MDSKKPNFKILLFPWLAHGHIFPYLELAKRILNKNKHKFHMMLCTTAINFSSITTFIQTNSLEASMELVELQLEPDPQLPPHYLTTKSLPSDLIPTLIKSFQAAKSSFSRLIADLNPHLIIYDVFQPWAATIASSRGIPAVHFAPLGAATMAYLHHQYTVRNDDFPFPEFREALHGFDNSNRYQMADFLSANVFALDQDNLFMNFRISSEIALLKTSPVLEEKYIDYLSSVSRKRILAVGPLVRDVDQTSPDEENSDMILQWLSKKEEHSTVYISFGSEYFLSKREIEQIAKGVELSGANFIWVIRFPAMENTATAIDEVFPEGFLERMKDRGKVVPGWAPQANILRHSSIGAFISHCGWSSLNESIYYGVPVIGMPVKRTMGIDGRILADGGACVMVVRERDGVFKVENIAKAINQVVVEATGERFRRGAREMREKMREEEEKLIEETAEQLKQLCEGRVSSDVVNSEI